MFRNIIFTLISFCTVAVTAQGGQITIFHTNDIHGHFAAERATWRKDNALVGGVAALSYHLDQLRAEHAQSLFLNAGDLMTGNPVCNMVYNGVAGCALPVMLDKCGIAAECPGNHEFDLGAGHLRDYLAASPHPMLCANLFEKSDGKAVTQASRVFEVGGLKVGVVGLLLNDLAGVASRTAIEPFRVDDAAQAAQRWIDELDPATDLLILLTHMGVDDDSVLATRVRGADVIVGGHSHTLLKHPLRVNNVLMVQAGAHLKNLGMLNLNVAGDSVSSYSDSLVELTRPAFKINTDAARLADSLEVVVQATFGQVIGELAEPWERGYYNGSNVGNWICDRLREKYRGDIALVNAGGIRANRAAGPITRLHVLELLPFSNSVVTFSASGVELQKLALEQARAQGEHKHGALEMSGLEIEYGKNGDQAVVKSVKVGGQPLDPGRRYRIVSIDYVAISQWSEYFGFKPADVEASGALISDVIADEIHAAKGPIHSDGQPRLRETR